APERRDRGLLAGLALDRLLRVALGGDVLDVRVEPALAAAAGHVDRVDGRPDDLAVGPHVALGQPLLRRAGEGAGGDGAAGGEVVGVRDLARRAPDELRLAAAEHLAERVVDLDPAPVLAEDR